MAKSDGGSGYKSSLKAPSERFLSQAVVHALDGGFRSPEDFLRHFKPSDLMQGLEAAPDLRAKILVEAAGVHEKIARKKSTTSAAEDLKLALDENVTNAEQLLSLFPGDDRVRLLDQRKLWAFVTEDEFWSPRNAASDVERAVSRMTFLIENALHENLITLQAVTDGITFESISTRLPLKELQKLVRHALKLGRDKKALGEPELLDAVPLKSLVSYVPLEHVYNSVIVERVAKPAGFLSPEAQPPLQAPKLEDKKAEDKKTEDRKTEDKKPEKEEWAALKGPPNAKPAVPPPPPSKREEAKEEPKPEVKAETKVEAGEPTAELTEPGKLVTTAEDELDALLESARPPAEEEARTRVLEKLAGINRLPPRHDSLSTPVLLSIESMYSELLTASTDEARELCIRDSFPNSSQLTQALLALIELLDPSIDINDPVIKDADLDSLIKVVLFEERHRYEQNHPSARPAGAPPLPPPPASRKPSSIAPPPLPRGNSLPPPLPDQKRAR